MILLPGRCLVQNSYVFPTNHFVVVHFVEALFFSLEKQICVCFSMFCVVCILAQGFSLKMNAFLQTMIISHILYGLLISKCLKRSFYTLVPSTCNKTYGCFTFVLFWQQFIRILLVLCIP